MIPKTGPHMNHTSDSANFFIRWIQKKIWTSISIGKIGYVRFLILSEQIGHFRWSYQKYPTLWSPHVRLLGSAGSKEPYPLQSSAKNFAPNFLQSSGASRASMEPEATANRIGYVGLLRAQKNLEIRHKHDPPNSSQPDNWIDIHAGEPFF